MNWYLISVYILQKLQNARSVFGIFKIIRFWKHCCWNANKFENHVVGSIPHDRTLAGRLIFVIEYLETRGVGGGVGRNAPWVISINCKPFALEVIILN